MPGTEQTTSLAPAQQDELEKRLHNAAKDNRILCSSTLAIAKSLGISSGEIGKTANKLNIRISKCQLGCF